MAFNEMVSARITPELAGQLRQVAQQYEVGESAIMRLALRHFLARKEGISFVLLAPEPVALTKENDDESK